MGATREQADRVSLDSMLQATGRRSFGPVLFVAGLVMLAPVIGDIPGVPVLMGVIVALTAGQLLLRRKHIWLPHWLLRRSVARGKLDKTLAWLLPIARFLDRWSRPRLSLFTEGTAMYVIAIASVAIALATPAMEVVPLTANVAGIAIAAFGLSLIVHDGLVALLALGFTIATLGLLAYSLI